MLDVGLRSIRAYSKKSGVSEASIYNLLGGKDSLESETIEKLAKGLDLSIEKFRKLIAVSDSRQLAA